VLFLFSVQGQGVVSQPFQVRAVVPQETARAVSIITNDGGEDMRCRDDRMAETIWDLLADIDNWPSWSPSVKEATLVGDLRESSVFRWKAEPGTITSTLERVDRPHEIGWRGRTKGINAVHVYKLEPHADGTRVHAEGSFDGPMVRLLKSLMRKTLQKGIDGGLVHLKAEAERRSAPTSQ
jgi:hypothetical protein